MKVYTRFNLTEREDLSRCLAMNYSYRQIAIVLKRPVSTISREINQRGFNRLDYRAMLAQERSQRLAHQPRRKRKLDTNFKIRDSALFLFPMFR